MPCTLPNRCVYQFVHGQCGSESSSLRRIWTRPGLSRMGFSLTSRSSLGASKSKLQKGHTGRLLPIKVLSSSVYPHGRAALPVLTVPLAHNRVKPWGALRFGNRGREELSSLQNRYGTGRRWHGRGV